MSCLAEPCEHPATTSPRTAFRALARLVTAVVVAGVGLLVMWFGGSTTASAQDLPVTPGPSAADAASAVSNPPPPVQPVQQLVSGVQPILDPVLEGFGQLVLPVVDELVNPTLAPITEPLSPALTATLAPLAPVLDPLPPVLDPVNSVVAPVVIPVLGAVPAAGGAELGGRVPVVGPVGPLPAISGFGSDAFSHSTSGAIRNLLNRSADDALFDELIGLDAGVAFDSSTLARGPLATDPWTNPAPVAPVAPSPAGNDSAGGASVGIGGARELHGLVPAPPWRARGTWLLVALNEQIFASADAVRPPVAPD